MGSTEDTTAVDPVIHIFGDKELSDVTFVVGGEEFRCHKMTLASRSTYFKAMFYSGFKEKDQDKISIEADPVAFNRIMELLYTGQFGDGVKLLTCSNESHAALKIFHLWKQISALLNLADQFDVLNYIVPILENYFIRSGECTFFKEMCTVAGAKLLIALTYGMEEYKKKFSATKDAVWRFLELIEGEQPTFSLDVNSLQYILTLSEALPSLPS